MKKVHLGKLRNNGNAFLNSISENFHIKLCYATTLDEQVNVCADHIHEFLSTIKPFHNICKCNLGVSLGYFLKVWKCTAKL